VTARFTVDRRGTVCDHGTATPIPAQAFLAPPRFELLAADVVVQDRNGGATHLAVVLRDTATGRDYPFPTEGGAISAARSLANRLARLDSFYGWRSDSPPPTVTFLDQPVTPVYLEAS